MKYLGFSFILIVFLSACHMVKQENALSPIQAIVGAATSAPQAISGNFDLLVKSTNSKHQMQFLNSEQDSKDQRNLIIVLRPNAVKELTEVHGIEPDDYFLGKKIRINGQARCIKKWVLYKNKNTKEYYYQTQVFVKSANQVTVL